MTLNSFISLFDTFSSWDPKKQIDYFCYFLTSISGKSGVFPKDIQKCFIKLSIKEYSRLPQYLSENVRDSKGKYTKTKDGYRLERRTFDEINMAVKNEPVKIQVSNQLEELIPKIKDSNEKSFLVEAINCYRVESNRATIILTWILAVDHLQNYIFGNKLNDFNTALSKNPDKKISKIVSYDNFGDLNESKFIEITRSAGIISNDTRKILDEKLGIRNSAAHPSSISFSTHKTTEFILDIVTNILLKY